MTKTICTIAFAIITHMLFAQPDLALVSIASGFNEPVAVRNAGDDRFFIVEKDGAIKILHADGTVTTFMDINSRVGSGGGEQGLLGLAFHPDYDVNGYFYVNYTNNSGDTRISRFSVDAGNPDLGNSTAESILLTISQPFSNHNGGDLAFGPEGYLYIPTGDGGSGDDPGNRAQDITAQKLGKILRIDVDGVSPYAIPADNPFVGVTGDDEIWAYGLRNPWRFSFDRLTGDMYTADVGQGEWEEMNVQLASSAGGENYGWRCYEGNEEYITSLCDLGDPFVFPAFAYTHSFAIGGYSITGGYVYRGSEFAGMYGYYIFCDYVSGNFWTMISDGAGGWTTALQAGLESDISSFGEGADGEIYACDLSSGEIYHIIDENCGAVWGVEVTGVTSTSATISWQDVGSASYKVQYRISGTAWTTVSTSGSLVSLTGLTPSANYTFRIKNKCPGVAGQFTKNGTFTTAPLKGTIPEETLSAQFVSNFGNGEFLLETGLENVTVLLHNITGALILEKNMSNGDALDVSSLAKGIYIAAFAKDGRIISRQELVVQ
ncbi:MAG: PQQ-dependent sugar dehydrogenase [Chitinophagales bacterium]